MKKKRKEGRFETRADKIEKQVCRACGGNLHYGGTYREGEVCLATMDLGQCHACTMIHQFMWIGDEPIVFTATSRTWMFSAGHKVMVV